MHSWHEPFDRIVALGNAHGIQVVTPVVGKAVRMAEVTDGRRWWENMGAERFQVKGQITAEQL